MIFLSLKGQVVKQLKGLKMYEILDELMIKFGHNFLICYGHLNEENLDMQVRQIPLGSTQGSVVYASTLRLCLFFRFGLGQ